jgi:hypothetical protein
MKNFVSAVIVALMPMISFATQPRVVAQMKTSGGLVRPGGSSTYTLSVLENGDVVQVGPMIENGQPPTVRTVGTLSEGVMEKLIANAERIKAGTLVDSEDGKPRCMDTPTTTYSLVRKNGKAVAFKQEAGCHEFYLQSDVDIYGLARALDGLSALATIQGR